MDLPQKDNRIYLDFAAATPVDPRVVEVMAPFWYEEFGNAGALHAEGVHAREVIEAARATVARCIAARSDEVVFTGSGTESNNIAILGLFRQFVEVEGRDPTSLHVITTQIEHNSVLDAVRALERGGVRATYLPVDRDGFVDLNALSAAITNDTVLVSVITASNEIGTIEPIREVSKRVRAARGALAVRPPYVHTDASQTPAWLAQDVSRLGVDLATFDAQKLYGPKGVGALYRARGVPLRPIQYGGKQEGGLRPGTPPTPFIVGFAKAFEIVYDERDDYVRDIAKLRNVFFERVLQAIPTAERNGAEGEARLANNINISFPGLEGEQLVIELDTRGVACSTRSACLLTEPGGSYIVQALGKGDAYAESSVRFTLGRNTTKKEVMSAVDILIETVRKLQGQ